jgi:hypothetical protein
MSDLPDDLRELDRVLRAVRFEPRASLGPEIEGRAGMAAEARPRASSGRRSRRLALAAAAASIAAAALALPRVPYLSLSDNRVTVDRCCYDLDGGGDADDGVLIHAQRDAGVHRLRVYEDRDGSRSFTAADVVRLDRGRQPAFEARSDGELVTIERCCLDFDGGGPNDDGLLVIGVPPDRVVMAAIYETGRDPAATAPLLR